MKGAFWIISVLVTTVTSSETTSRNRPPQNQQQSQQRKPNIVLILTDDQDVELGSLNYMPKTLRAIKAQGAEFRHAYVTTPMCCPSRSSLLTGMYVHNHNVYTNNDNCSSTQWQATYERKSFATYLNNAGYRTGYFGKYLNKYNGSHVPPGWREWGGLIMNSKYYNYSINMNGKKIKHGFDYYKDYYPDLITNDSIAFLRQSKKNNAHKPVMLTMSFPAPHGPEDSAPQYSQLFFNETTHHTPSYDYAPNPDKQWILKVTNKMQPIHKKFTDLLMTKRLQTLQSVDSAVQMVVDELEALGELDNTYIIYTSDHGYHLGQFGLIKGKSFPFEFDVRVPFLVRGPGIEPGSIVQDIVLNIDLAPTFLNIAGVDPPPHMDGRSVLPLFLNAKRKRLRWPDTFLIESSGRRETPYLDAKLKAIRKNGAITTETPITTHGIGGTSTVTTGFSTTTASTTTAKTTSAKIYDSGEDLTDDEEEDDDEMDEEEDEDEEEETDDLDTLDEFNDNDDANSTNKIHIRGEDNELLVNSRQLPIINKLKRLEVECTQGEMNLPCHVHQKWYCLNDNGRWRKHKCKIDNYQIYHHYNNTAYRKCACFTHQGLIYRKMPLSVITRRHTQDHQIKRLLFTADLENPHRLSKRHKRDTLAQVEDVMRDVQGKLQGLNAANNLNNTAPILEDRSNLATNVIAETSAGCEIMPHGHVNCPNNIYHDRKSWRLSRSKINNEINQLKDKLEKLKEIRKHLKQTRPISEPVEEEVVEQVESTNRTSAKRRKRPNHHRHHKSVVSSTEAPSTTERVEATTSSDQCLCETNKTDYERDEQRSKDAEKRRLKDEKLRRKLRKQRKRVQQDKECASERMNCFHHDKEHWKTAPLWTEGPFCFCMNANNNTYSCLRTINSTHNILYCEFTTGVVTFYNLRIDPYELQNRVQQLKSEERLFLHQQLRDLVACKGRSCTVGHQHQKGVQSTRKAASSNVLPVAAHHRYRKRKPGQEAFADGRGGEEMLGRTLGVRISSRNRNATMAKMGILREGRINNRRRRRKS